MASKPYNGFRSWAYWNVSLWLNNDEGLYNLMRDAIRYTHNRTHAAQQVFDVLSRELSDKGWCGVPTTPDGAPYSVDKIRSAMRGITR